MAELREKGISLERSGLMHFVWILGFVLYIGLICFLGVGRHGVLVERGLCRTALILRSPSGYQRKSNIWVLIFHEREDQWDFSTI